MNEPCRRRAIYALKEKENGQNKTREITPHPLSPNAEALLNGNGRGSDSKAVSAWPDEAGRGKTSNVQADTDEDKQTAKEVKSYMCPKCNREYKRGMYFHQKYCRGL